MAKKVKEELFHKDYSLANLFLWAALEHGDWPYWTDFKEIQGCCSVSKDCLSSTVAVEPHTETHFPLDFLLCIYGQLSVPFKREGNKSFLFSAKIWACLAVVRAKRPVVIGTGKVSALFGITKLFSCSEFIYKH